MNTIVEFKTETVEGSWDIENRDCAIRIGKKWFHFNIYVQDGRDKTKLLTAFIDAAISLSEYLTTPQSLFIDRSGVYLPVHFLLLENNDPVYTFDGDSITEHIIDAFQFRMIDYKLHIITMMGMLSSDAPIYQLVYEGV